MTSSSSSDIVMKCCRVVTNSRKSDQSRTNGVAIREVSSKQMYNLPNSYFMRIFPILFVVWSLTSTHLQSWHRFVWLEVRILEVLSSNLDATRKAPGSPMTLRPPDSMSCAKFNVTCSEPHYEGNVARGTTLLS